MLNVQCFTFNVLQEHTYVVYDETKNCAIVDPGCFEAHEKQRLSDFIRAQNLQVTHLINTHCHIDHILGNQYIKDSYGVKLTIHPKEITNLQLAPTYAPIYGIIGYEPTEPDLFVEAGDNIIIGNSTLEVLHVPGHSLGHIALYSRKDAICLVGDVLFKGYVGRTDLPGGNYDSLLDSICKKLFPLGDQVTIYPGHGPTSTLGAERQHNPFCRL
jgi:hydroxyacylglutathione hydrolase